MTNDVNSPVAILDKEIAKYPSYTIETFELCDCCGARFGIGYHQACKHHADAASSRTNCRTSCAKCLPRTTATTASTSISRNLGHFRLGRLGLMGLVRR